MTYEEAKNLTSFKHYCSCGGFAGEMNKHARENPNHPHLSWCAQYAEWEEWNTALKSKQELPCIK